ncbi:MAG: GIY-YIG nuclease family protein [Candidatus Magasanikbacteria bacterium]|nr:GIY-YIG nuclease family protein [Candidatus Magasanikbacteria bacterium]
MWKVYILLSIYHRKTYVGSTDNLDRRMAQHNSANVRSTAHYIPWTLIYLECYPTEQDARNREKELKSASGRRYLKKAINHIIEIWAGSSTG